MKYGYRYLLIGLITLVSWAGTEAAAQDCQADFHFAYLDTETVILYPAPGSFTTLVWTIDNVPYVAEPGTAFWFSPSTDTTWVCLTVVDGAGCSDTHCVQVYEDSPESLCHWTDCVWPGDATGDRKANIYDVLNIGLGYGATGPERLIFPDPNNHLVWAPNFAEDWGAVNNLPDFKHLDCDGNGLVDAADLEAIHHNYTPDLSFSTQPEASAPPVFLVLSLDTIFIEELINTASIEITAELWAGTTSQPFDSLYGIALGIRHPEGINYASTYYEPTAYLGDPSEVIDLQRSLSNWDSNRLDLAFSRTNGHSVGGGGPLATVSFIISSDIIGGREEPQYDLFFALEGILLLDENGDTLSYQLPGESGVLVINNGVISSENAPEAPTWRVFPNPATDKLNLSFSEPTSGLLRLYNSQGQLVRSLQLAASSATEIAVQGLPYGVYTLESLSDTGARHQQKVVIR